MRVTQSMVQNLVLADLNRTRARLVTLQEQASSGLRVNRPSDDPAAAARATRLRASLDEVAQLERGVSRAELRLGASEDALQSATDILIRAEELALQGANGTYDDRSRDSIAAEVESLYEQLLAVSNTRVDGSSVFAGFASEGPAFSSSGPFSAGLPAPTASFVGDSNEIEIEIDSGIRVASTLDGRRVFLGDGDGDGSPDPGRVDLFETLGDLWEALDTNDPAAAAAVDTALEEARSQIEVERARLGARLGRVEAAQNELARREVDLRTQLSDTQDADTVAVFSDLVAVETALNASLQSAANVIQPTLLDFLG